MQVARNDVGSTGRARGDLANRLMGVFKEHRGWQN